MSDVITTPPPPPPPPPTAGSPSGSEPPKAAFDFVKPFAFVFEDARWVNKVLIGGLFQLLAMIIVGIPFFIIICMVMIPAIFVGVMSSHHNSDYDPSGGMIACVWCLVFPLGLVYA